MPCMLPLKASTRMQVPPLDQVRANLAGVEVEAVEAVAEQQGGEAAEARNLVPATSLPKWAEIKQ